MDNASATLERRLAQMLFYQHAQHQPNAREDADANLASYVYSPKV